MIGLSPAAVSPCLQLARCRVTGVGVAAQRLCWLPLSDHFSDPHCLAGIHPPPLAPPPTHPHPEEHFKAVTITDASGRTLRFCQQCTKLELLEW